MLAWVLVLLSVLDLCNNIPWSTGVVGGMVIVVMLVRLVSSLPGLGGNGDNKAKEGISSRLVNRLWISLKLVPFATPSWFILAPPPDHLTPSLKTSTVRPVSKRCCGRACIKVLSTSHDKSTATAVGDNYK